MTLCFINFSRHSIIVDRAQGTGLIILSKKKQQSEVSTVKSSQASLTVYTSNVIINQQSADTTRPLCVLAVSRDNNPRWLNFDTPFSNIATLPQSQLPPIHICVYHLQSLLTLPRLPYTSSPVSYTHLTLPTILRV